MKTCTRCLERLPDASFYKRGGSRKDRSSVCQDCKREVVAEYNDKRRSAGQISYSSRQYHTTRYEVLSAYSDGVPACACCGERLLEFLSIDHVDGGGSLDRMSGSIYGRLKRLGFPPGFRVLCHCCNQSLGAYGYCPHGGVKPSLHSFRARVKMPAHLFGNYVESLRSLFRQLERDGAAAVLAIRRTLGRNGGAR